MSRPNLLILHAHDMGRYNSIYGHPLPTPNMARLARGGFVFNNAHCAAPTCSPSRAAMMTGLTAHENAVTGLTHRGWDMSDYNRHLAAHLGRSGYHTVLAGVQHEFADESRAPYAEHLPSPRSHTLTRDPAAATAAAEWLLQHRGNPPFFMWLGFFLPHVPFLPAAEGEELRCQSSPLPDAPEIRADWADYAHSIARTDFCVGIVLDALREAELDRNTVVLLTTDHGIPFPGMKCSLTGHGTGVTLAIRDPRRPAGGCSDALVSHLDVVPSLCDLLGVEPPLHTHGVSIVPVLDNLVDGVREDAFAEVNYHVSYQPMRSVRTTRWNYIRYFQPGRTPLANIDLTRTKELLVRKSWPGLSHPGEELFDLAADPMEKRNLANDPDQADVLGDMRSRMDRWMQNTRDPLLDGPVPAPSGAVVVSSDAEALLQPIAAVG